MCIVCVEIIKDKMSILEAERNLGELGHTEKDRKLATHYQDLYDAMVNWDQNNLGRLLKEGVDEEESKESFSQNR